MGSHRILVRRLIGFALSLNLFALGAAPALAMEGARADGHVSAAASIARSPSILTGRVVDASGEAERQALVVSSAGGRAVTDEQGRFELAIELDESASSVRVTAVGYGSPSRVASVTVTAPPAGVSAPVGVLALGQAAGCSPDWLPTFGGSTTLGGSVWALLVWDDGLGGGPQLYAGGNFTAASGLAAGRIAKWNGQVWSLLGTGLDSSVLALAVFDDGTGPALFAAGAFDVAGGIAASRIAKWDGTAWHPLGSGLSGFLVYTLAVFDDGSGPALYAGGDFAGAGGAPANNVARWDGTTWSALASGTNAGVHALAAFDDGSGPALYAGGVFTSAGSAPASRVARWNGASWSAVGAGFDDSVDALCPYAGADGSQPALYAGGAFRSSGAPMNAIARWNGTQWSAVPGGLQTGIIKVPNPTVDCLAVFDEGSGSGPSLYVSGYFFLAGGVGANRMAKFDGLNWSALGEGPGGVVAAIAGFDDGSGAGPRLYTALFQSIRVWNGSSWSTFGESQIGPSIGALAVFDDGSGAGPELYAGNSVPGRIAKWNGQTWTPLVSGVNAQVWALQVHDDGLGGGPALYAAGSFTQAGGASANRIAKWNGTSWSPLGSGLNDHVWALEVFDDGGGPKLYAGGDFTIAGGIQVNQIARWNGTTWSALSGAASGVVKALKVHADPAAGGVPALYVAGGSPQGVKRWDGASWSNVGSAFFNSYVYTLASFDDGSGSALYAAGAFTSPTLRIAKWSAGTWTAVGAGLGGNVVNSLEVFDEGTGPALYAGGDFTSAGGIAALRIAKWDGAAWSPLGAGLPAEVHVLESVDTGAGASLHVAGAFASSPSGDSYLARWGCGPTVVTSFCSGDGSATACPCGNAGAVGHGCANSIGASALLVASGTASIANDTLVLHGSGMPAGTTIYLQGTSQQNGGQGSPFGDGLRCVGGTLVRLGSVASSGGASQYPSAGHLPISVKGINVVGSSRTYQAWYRDGAPFCGPDSFNLSNGLQLTWAP